MAGNKQDIKESLNVLKDYKRGLLTQDQAAMKIQSLTGLTYGTAKSFVGGMKKEEIILDNNENVIPFPKTIKEKKSE